MALFINVFNDSASKYLPDKAIREVIGRVFEGENISDAEVNVIFLNDEAIHELNKKYLTHDYATDVISFSLSDEAGKIEGEIYISVDTAFLQAKEYKVSLRNELMRLSAHGALHLAGYDDNTNERRSQMSGLETKYIAGGKKI